MPVETYGPILNRIRNLLVGSSKGLTITEISRKMGTNRNSVAKYLDVLHTSGIVEVKIVGSAKLFTLSKRVPLNSIINISSDYILILDEDLHITYANENLLKFEDKSLDELVGRDVESLDIMWTTVTDIRKLMQESIKGKEIITEVEIQKNGNLWFFRVKFVPGILENNKRGLILILTNITDLKIPRQNQEQAEAQRPLPDKTAPGENHGLPGTADVQSHPVVGSEMSYRDYLELARDGIWAVDESLKTTFVNSSMAAMLGYSVRDMTGKSLNTFLEEEGKSIIKKFLRAVHDGKQVAEYRDIEFIRNDGTRIYTATALTPFLNKEGKLGGSLQRSLISPNEGKQKSCSGKVKGITGVSLRRPPMASLSSIPWAPSGWQITRTPGTLVFHPLVILKERISLISYLSMTRKNVSHISSGRLKNGRMHPSNVRS